VKGKLQYVAESLQYHSSTPKLDAELLLAKAIDQSRAWLYAHWEYELTSEQQSLLENLLSRRRQGEPMAYLLEEKEFWSLKLAVNPAVLIPRPETEHLIEWILAQFTDETLKQVLDLGTGSGALALAIASEFPNCCVDAVDISAAALKVAKENAAHHQLHNIAFYQGNWCQALPPKKYSLIVSNPPYIAAQDPHLAELTYEPLVALEGGSSGLEAIQIIVQEAPLFLKSGGYLVLEQGYDQSDKVREIFIKRGFTDITLHTDLAELPRFTTAKWIC
jgi:release factor glutamine methyltransferase